MKVQLDLKKIKNVAVGVVAFGTACAVIWAGLTVAVDSTILAPLNERVAALETASERLDTLQMQIMRLEIMDLLAVDRVDGRYTGSRREQILNLYGQYNGLSVGGDKYIAYEIENYTKSIEW